MPLSDLLSGGHTDDIVMCEHIHTVVVTVIRTQVISINDVIGVMGVGGSRASVIY